MEWSGLDRRGAATFVSPRAIDQMEPGVSSEVRKPGDVILRVEVQYLFVSVGGGSLHAIWADGMSCVALSLGAWSGTDLLLASFFLDDFGCNGMIFIY